MKGNKGEGGRVFTLVSIPGGISAGCISLDLNGRKDMIANGVVNLKPPEEIITARLRIRPFQPEDAEAFSDFMTDHIATRFLDFTDEQKTREGARALLDSVIASYTSCEPIFSLAVEERESGLYVGSCGLFPLLRNKEMECYYTVIRSRWGRGYALEYMNRLLEYGFEELGLNRVAAYTGKLNFPSQHIAENLGMRYQGMIRRGTPPHESRIYSITRKSFLGDRNRRR